MAKLPIRDIGPILVVFDLEMNRLKEAAEKAAQAMEMLQTALRNYEAWRSRRWAVRISRWLFGDRRK